MKYKLFKFNIVIKNIFSFNINTKYWQAPNIRLALYYVILKIKQKSAVFKINYTNWHGKYCWQIQRAARREHFANMEQSGCEI